MIVSTLARRPLLVVLASVFVLTWSGAGPATVAASAASLSRGHMPAGRPGGRDAGTLPGMLNGVTCTSKDSCWAVGSNGQNGQNAALRWDGTGWSPVTTPEPGPDDSLAAVTCTSRANCWAVGGYSDSSQTSLTEILHWNGTTWSSVPSPNPHGAVDDTLASVACASARNCWAVGNATNVAGVDWNITLYWNGSTWSTVPVPNPGDTTSGYGRLLGGVTCTPDSGCWTAGLYVSKAASKTETEVFRWNGTRWARATTPNVGGLNSITCMSATDCWAVGGTSLHWNGTRWSNIPVPGPPGRSDLLGAGCAARADCWAVGILYKKGERTYALRWNGTRWSRISTPNPGAHEALNNLSAVACTSRTNCWAVGSYWDHATRNHIDLALRWNGTQWSQGLIPGSAR